MNEKNRLTTYVIISMFIHITSILFLMTIKTDPRKEPRIAFVELVDIPRATEIAKPRPGILESKNISKKKAPLPVKERVLQGKVPDLPVNPDLPPEKVLPKEVSKERIENNRGEKKPVKERAEGEAGEEKGSKADSLKGTERENKRERIPSIKDLTPSLGRMVLASKARQRKGKGEGTGENIDTEKKPKKEGDYAEIAKAGTILTPLDNPSIQYISYFAGIKRKIELVWQYPFDAIQSGIQGDLILDFAIASNGNLKNIQLVRSSGFAILDDEAIDSIKKAAPFSPIPEQYSINELNIRANFVYEMHYLKIK